MKLRMLVIALIGALGSGCASTDKGPRPYQIEPVSKVSHGAPDAQAYYQLARYYQGQKRLDMAEAAYRKSLSLDSSQVAAYNALGSLYAERGELDKSVQQFKNALAIDPGSGYLQNNLGFAYYLQGRLADAYEAVRKALALDATFERGWANLRRIADAYPDTQLAAAAKSRRVAALPATLQSAPTPSEAAEPVSVAAAPAVETKPAQTAAVVVAPAIEVKPAQTAAVAVAPAIEVKVAQAEAVVVPPAIEVKVERAAAPATPSGTTVVDASGAGDAARKSEYAVPVAAPAAAPEFSLHTGNGEERVDDGKFVLVSTSRDVVNLTKPQAEPLVIAKAEPTAPLPERIIPLPASVPLPAWNSGIDYSAIGIEVSNANGVGGFAKKFSAQLRADSIPVRRITNHTSFLLKETIIEYQPGYQDAAHALMRRVQIDARAVPAKGPRSGTNVRILLGRNALPAA